MKTLKDNLKDFMLLYNYKLIKETRFDLIFINGDREITIKLRFKKEKKNENI